MKTRKGLKVLKKTSTEYLKKMYHKSVSYILNRETWRSTESDTYGKSKILLHTRKSLKKLGNELDFFKFPTIVGAKIIYYKTMSMFFDKFEPEHQTAMISEENYLLRDLPPSADYTNDNELKIFKLPTVDSLEKLYYKSIGKL
jgi:hypothetical protein